VIGGGVGGCSILYWLTRLGWDDVVLVERADLTSGSTFHSAGLVGQLRSSLSLTRMMMESVDLYRSLEAEVGLETGWREVGSLRLASSEERMEEIARQAGWAKTFGLPLELISPTEAQTLFPPMSTDGVLGAAFLPTDGYIDPSQLTFALAEGARRRGAEVCTSTRVTAVRTERGRVTGLETDRGEIETEIVVNAGGMFAGELGALAGVTVPVIPMAHEYLVLKPSGLPLDMPTMRDPSLLVYYRPESGGLIMGGYERHCAPWSLDGIPADFNGKLLEEDWPRFEELMRNAIVRVPSLEEMEVVKLINGPEAFTPDGEFILGPSDVRGFWVAAGFCAHGLAGAGGMGKLVAEWIVEGTPSLDVWHMDSRRFGAAYRSRAYTLARTQEIYETYYDVKYPGHEREAGRPLRVSSANARLRDLGAVFGEKSGWERANWFEPNAAAGDGSLRPRGWAGKLWSPAIGAEHRACREAAALFDESSFAKLDVVGPGAADFLEGLCANRVARETGRVTYTQMLNPRGGIECDFTVTRLAAERFRIVTGTAFGQHDAAWIRQHAPDDGSVQVVDVTSAYACLGLWGPASRTILQPLTVTDLSNEAFPYMTAQELAVGPVPAASTGSPPAATRRSTRCDSRRATACGGRTSPPRTRRTRRGSASPSSSTRATSSDATRSSPRVSRSGGCAASPSPTPVRSRWARSRSGSAPTPPSVVSPAEASATRRVRPSRTRTSPPSTTSVPRSRWRSSASGSPASSPASRSTTPPARRSAHEPGRRTRAGNRPLQASSQRQRVHGVTGVDDRALAAAVARVWPDGRSTWEVLGGGITNHNVKVTRPDGAVVLRVAGKDTDLLGIDRAVELAATRAAAEVGVGPEVVDFVEPEGWLVTRFVDGSIPSPETLREPEQLRRVARALRAFHHGPPIPGRFDALEVVEAYHGTAVERGATIPDPFATAHDLARRIAALRADQPPRPCHNDLLNANFIDDGERLVIVDWEYAGMGDPFFDLANFSINHDLDPDGRAVLLAAYAGDAHAAGLATLDLMRFMSDFREAMWGVVQGVVSELDFDFRAYATEHFQRMERTAAEPAFRAALGG